MEAMNFYCEYDEALFTVVGFLSGVIVHNAVFIRGEWNVQAPQIFLHLVTLYISSPVLANILQNTLVSVILSGIASWSREYLPGLVTSILFYRIVRYPLIRAGIPGLWYAKVTKLWHVWACRTSKNHLVLDDLYKEYGAFVRTGIHH